MCLNLTFICSFLYATAQSLRIAPTTCHLCLCLFFLLFYLDIEGKTSPLCNVSSRNE